MMSQSIVRSSRWARRRCSTKGGAGDETHPIIDVGSLFSEDSSEVTALQRKAAVEKIGIALRTRGYFYAKNVSVLDGPYIKSVYDYAKKIHALNVDVKRKFSQRDGHGAYSGLDIGQAELAYDPSTVASVRAWDYSRTRFTLKKADDPNENRYPGEEIVSPCYVSFMDDLYERQNVLGKVLLTAFAESMNLPSDRFSRMFESGDFGTIRLLHYPPNEDAERVNVGISAHTDFEAFTLMHQDAAGLQFIPASGESGWIDAPVHDDMFVVIVGDVLERFTNGELRATPHRVKMTPHTRRSIIRFNAVNADTLIEPMPEFVSETNPPKYTPVTMKRHMETTMRNLEEGKGAWCDKEQKSLTATYAYD